MGPTTWSSVSISAACSKWFHVGRSWASWPWMPALGHTVCTVLRASEGSSAQHRSIWAYIGPLPPASAKRATISLSGDVPQ